MDEFNPQLHQKILERYLKLVEKNHRANDYALDRNRQLDLVKKEQKRLSNLLKVERANLRERSEELENLSEYVGILESQAKEQSSELSKLGKYIILLEDQSNIQNSEINRLGDYVLLLESEVKGQTTIIDDLKTECLKSKEEHNKLVELAEKHSELIHYSQQLETEKDGIIQE